MAFVGAKSDFHVYALIEIVHRMAQTDQHSIFTCSIKFLFDNSRRESPDLHASVFIFIRIRLYTVHRSDIGRCCAAVKFGDKRYAACSSNRPWRLWLDICQLVIIVTHRLDFNLGIIMNLVKPMLEAFEGLLGLERSKLNIDDEINLSSHIHRYIIIINTSRMTNPQSELSLDDTIRQMITSMKEIFEQFVKDQSELSEVIKCEQDATRNSMKEIDLLKLHLDLRRDLNIRHILPGQPVYLFPNRWCSLEELSEFEWGTHLCDVPQSVYENLKEPNTIRINQAFCIDTYSRFHQFLYYEEACVTYRNHRYNLQEVSLEVYDTEHLLLKHYNLILDHGDRLILKTTKYQFYLEAYIHGEVEEGYLIKMNSKIHKSGVDGLKFDIYFVPDVFKALCNRRHHAVRYMSSNRTSVHTLFPNIRPDFDMLMPRICVNPTQINRMRWFDERLNLEQRMAVIQIMQSEARPAPFILFGPPGTGKKTTVIEAILQIYKHDAASKILVCSHREDHELACKILDTKVIPKEDVWRLVEAQRLQRDMSQDLAEISKLSKWVTPEMFMKYRVVVSTCYQADRLRTFEDKFDYLFICNANLVDEPQSLICIRHLKPNGCTILAGDQWASEPSCSSQITKANGFDVSLMERLLAREPYRSRSNPYGTFTFDKRYKAILAKNYRCDYRLMKPSNELFYDHRMHCEVQTPDWLLESMGLLKNPLLFHHVEGMTSRSFHEQTWNPNELVVCMSYLERLIATGLQPHQIGLITPQLDQGFRLELVVETNLFQRNDDITIQNNGRSLAEKEVVIISTVKSELNDAEDDEFNAREFNMAIGRAKWMVIVVGNRNYLKNHPFGQKYLKYAQEVTFPLDSSNLIHR